MWRASGRSGAAAANEDLEEKVLKRRPKSGSGGKWEKWSQGASFGQTFENFIKEDRDGLRTDLD